jgi:O-antigen/teichoic acid export membrane protein
MSIVGYLAILDFGFGSAVTRYTVKYNTENDKESLYKLYGTVSVIYVLIGVLALSVCCVLGFFTPQLFSSTMTVEEVSKIQIMMYLCGINLLFTFPLQISASVLIAHERFIFKNGVNLIRTYLQPAILILLLYLVHIKSVGAIVVVTLFNLLTYLSFYIYSVRKLDFKFSLQNYESKMIRCLITFSAWMFLVSVFEHLQYNSGQFIIGLFQGSDVVAVWGIAMIFILNYRSLSTAITNVFLPSYISNTFKNDNETIQKTTYKVTRLQAYVLFFIMANFILFGQYFIDMWAGKGYHDAYIVALIVMLPMTIALLLDFSYLLQIATNKLKFRIVTLFAGFILAFLAVFFWEGITLVSYAYVIAGSIVLGQIICVIYFIIRKIDVSLKEIVKGLSPIAIITVALTVATTHVAQMIPDSLFSFFLEIVVFNILLGLLWWFISFSESEKEIVFKIMRK